MLLTLLLLACSGGEAPDVRPEAPPEKPGAEAPPAEAAPEAKAPPAVVHATHGMRGVDYACAPCVGTDDIIASHESSSTLEGDEQKYGGEKIHDNDPATAWCEGDAGPGKGAKITLKLKKPHILDGASVLGGYFKSEKTLTTNARLKEIELSSGDWRQTVQFADPKDPIVDTSMGSKEKVPAAEWFEVAKNNPAMFTLDAPEGPISEVTLEVKDVYPGSKYEDLCISQLTFLVVDPDEL